MNVDKLRLALKVAEIKAEQDLLDQSIWVSQEECGTTACFAGHWALEQGMKVDSTYDRVIEEDGMESHLCDWAQKDLGLTSSEADLLFYHSEDLQDLQVYVRQIISRVHLSEAERDRATEDTIGSIP